MSNIERAHPAQDSILLHYSLGVQIRDQRVLLLPLIKDDHLELIAQPLTLSTHDQNARHLCRMKDVRRDQNAHLLPHIMGGSLPDQSIPLLAHHIKARARLDQVDHLPMPHLVQAQNHSANVL